MRLIGGLLIASVIGLASMMPASATPLSSGDMSLAPRSDVELAQYYDRRDLCRNWRRQCARLYGWESRQWYQCMNQPQARRDCRRRDYY